MAIQDYRCYTKHQIFKLAFTELVLFILAFGLGLLISSDDQYYLFHRHNYSGLEFLYKLLITAMSYSIIASVCMFILGLYKKHMNLYLQEQYLRVVMAMFLVFVILNNISYWMEAFDVGKGVWLTSIFLSYIAIVLSRTVLGVITKNSSVKEKVLILGSGNKALQLKNDIEDSIELKSIIVGYVYKPGERERLSRDRVLDISINNKKQENELLEYCLDNSIDTIVVAVDDRRNNFPLSELVDCKQNGVKIIEVMEYYEHELGKTQLSMLDPSWVLYSNKLHESIQYELNKRSIDVLLSIIILVVLSPLFLLISCVIKLTTGVTNKILITTENVGLYGRNYMHYKFNCYGKNGKLTVFGKVLEKTKVFLLPEILNVLKGDVSFVGPKPLSNSETQEMNSELWYFKHRNIVKPGLISWGYARKNQNSNFSNHENQNKISYYKHLLEFDLFYIKKRTLLLDLLILLNKIYFSSYSYKNSVVNNMVEEGETNKVS